MSKPLLLTDVVLRDAHQSLLATRFRLDDMLPIAAELDKIGYWSLESWGGATFDSCIRYLGEDPWVRIRELKKAMPNTKQQMLLRGQNLLGYRHYADDVVKAFVERAHTNGVDVFRIFDAMNDVRNLTTAVKAAVEVGAHAQGTISYTVSPVHKLQNWLDMAKQIEDMGCHSLFIKDMAGLLKPYECEELVTRLKESIDLPIAMQCHATTGLSTATYMKAIDAGIDMLDTAISSMSMTYGHSATETFVSILEGTDRDTNIDLNQLEKIAAYFRDVRKKYAKFEGSLKGVDARILTAQVPGGMLTNMENQLREQGAEDRLDEVLKEIPRVREDLGYIPLVTPTSQIVGTQSVINVLTGERYKSITKETAGVLKGEYGSTIAPVNADLQARVLDGGEARSEVLPHSLAFNLFLHNSPLQANGYCEEELKMLNETRKIMQLPELSLSATCVRVPVLRAHSEAVNIEFEAPLSVAEARAALAQAPGVELIEDFETNRFPMPTDVTGRDPVAVGRIRQDLSHPQALELWLCGDQIRKGAALNAVQIAELLLESAR